MEKCRGEKAHVLQAKSRMSQLVDNVKNLDIRLLISVCGSVPDRQYEETRLRYEKAKISHVCGPFSLPEKSKRVAWSEDGACLRCGWLRTMAWPCGEKERLIFQGVSFCGCIGWRRAGIVDMRVAFSARSLRWEIDGVCGLEVLFNVRW